MATVVVESTVFAIVKVIVVVGVMDSTTEKSVIAAGVTAFMMLAVIFAPGVIVSTIRRVISCT